jgi:hypothetical protein
MLLTKPNHMTNQSLTKTSLLFALVFSGISWANQKAQKKYPIITVNGFTFSDLEMEN